MGKIFVCLQRQIGPETGDIRHDIDTIMGALVGDMEEEYKVFETLTFSHIVLSRTK